MPGTWGVADCLLTVADAVEAVTGVDLAAKVRGTYSSELGAAKLMRRRKCADVEAVLAKLFPPVGRLMPQFAQSPGSSQSRLLPLAER